MKIMWKYVIQALYVLDRQEIFISNYLIQEFYWNQKKIANVANYKAIV